VAPARAESSLPYVAQLPQTRRQPSAVRQAASPYEKWLNEDVAYILIDRERASFAALSTDAERERFIEQFWLRRDPTPGTAQNEFKEEYYRRIAYTNERYGTADAPGWRSDRGRTYMIWGPPDEIDAHPSGGMYVHPAA